MACCSRTTFNPNDTWTLHFRCPKKKKKKAELTGLTATKPRR